MGGLPRRGPRSRWGRAAEFVYLGLFFFNFCCSCLTITAMAVKDTSTDSTQRECGAEERHQIAPMSHPIAILSAILLGSQEHPQGKTPETKASMPAGRDH